MPGRKILMIDNYDSFTYNLVQFLGVLGAELVVLRNDHFTLDQVESVKPDGIVVSPGPRAPADAGLSKEVLLRYGPRIKTLGVCLGHQCIGEAFGGKVVRAPAVMHGKTSKVLHDGGGVFRGVDSPFEAARYHSLVIDPDSLPDCLEVTSRTADGVIMGVRHVEHPIEGIQFHPESFMTGPGMLILENFMEA
ncbi:MAG: aminodeoxychorismate/anthranilate synthase component II [Actinobacteria bacterium]|nr:aminodeoxychorismate/anthranilate synthase component II [Actinomycetota bacterium]MBU2689030.1 aminodeoxychorismate/anthranilate synthase component II [Actinomycetota bacterium]